MGAKMKLAWAKASAIVAGFVPVAFAGPKLSWDDGARSLEIQQVYQFWGAYTFDPHAIPDRDPRVDFMVRRARWTFKGQAAPDLAYQVGLAYDNLAKDPLTTGVGGTAQPSNPTTLQVLDAYATWTLDTAWASLTVGIFRPVLGRELVSSFANLASLDNALTYSYLRDALFTRTTAREGGVDLGGAWSDTALKVRIGYDLGVFDASQEKLASGSVKGSTAWSPLVTGRVEFVYGDPESKTYSPSRAGSSGGKRSGVTLGAYASWQGATDVKLDTTFTVTSIRNKANTKDSIWTESRSVKYAGGFDENQVFGLDLQAEWKGFLLNGEVAWLHRSFDAANVDKVYVLAKEYTDNVWHVRAAYFLPVGKVVVEPSAMYSSYTAADSSSLNPGGEESLLDLGIDTWLSKNTVRVGLHYVMEDGKAKSGYTSGVAKSGAYSQKDDAYVASLQLSF